MRFIGLSVVAIALCAANNAAAQLPAGSWGWQTVPNVIRTDGVESFVVEIETNRAVSGVTMDINDRFFSMAGATADTVSLRDDGLGGDRVAGDMIYTSGPMTYKSSADPFFPSNYLRDPNSPAGLHITYPGIVSVQEIGGAASRFLVGPEVGLLRSNVPARSSRMLAPDVQVSQHLINVQTSGRYTQSEMRGLSFNVENLTQRMYEVVPDAFDFLMLFSTYKIEDVQFTGSVNFIAGQHETVQINFTGTGQSLRDSSEFYGSAGRLQAVNYLDTMERGIYSNNAVHELMHQWSYFLSPSLGLGSGAHSSPYSNIDSVLGGFRWIDNGDGTYRIDPNGGPSEGKRLSPFEEYLMGFTDGSQMGPLLAYDQALGFPVPLANAGTPITPDDIVANVTLADIQSRHGARTPGPAEAQRDFALGFVAESHNRLLTPSEITFYDILAEHFTSGEVVDEQAYDMEFTWAPIGPYFGNGTTWTSVVPVEGGLDGDFDLDGFVDGRDFLLWQRGGSPSPLSSSDLAFWKTNFGKSSSGSHAVPEPAAWLLVLSAMGALLRRRRNCSHLAAGH